MPQPAAMRAASAAMPPKPIRPSVLPVSCIASRRSQLPSRMPRSISPKLLADGPHQRDRAFGHRGVAITLDGVDGDAALGELFRIHVAARAGAEEDDVLQAFAHFSAIADWHRGVVDDHDLGIAEQAGQIVGLDRGIAVDADRQASCERSSLSVTAARVSFASTNRARTGLSFSSSSVLRSVLYSDLKCNLQPLALSGILRNPAKILGSFLPCRPNGQQLEIPYCILS